MKVVKSSNINIKGLKTLHINPAIGVLLQSELIDVIQAGSMSKYAGRLVLMKDSSSISRKPMEDQVAEWAKRYGVSMEKVDQTYLANTDSLIGLASVHPDTAPTVNWKWGSGNMLKVVQLVVNVSK